MILHVSSQELVLRLGLMIEMEPYADGFVGASRVAGD
jgi:hypothetical protein